MKQITLLTLLLILIIPINSCNQEEKKSDMNIIYLHHSTGGVIWQGARASLFTRAVRKVSQDLAEIVTAKAKLPALFDKYNEENNRNYLITEMVFPKQMPYGWKNYPYDYYNIWVKNAGNEPFMEEPTLEMLTKHNQVIIFKHCFPVSNINPDQDSSDINSEYKSLGNYKLQYNAIRDKLHEFPNTKFIVWTGAALVRSAVEEGAAARAQEFFSWVRDEWDQPDDNIYLWDFYSLQTEGGLYFKDEYASSPNDSHPGSEFAGRAAELLFNRIIDVIENNGTGTDLTGSNI